MESKFTGGVLGLIGQSLLCGLLTTVTCGIAAPWAICMFINWFFKHTTIDGKTLSFTGKGGKLIGQWIKWMLLTIVTLGIYGFWVPVKAIKWVVSNVHVKEA